jgi:RNA polymerase sigma factor (sigma-70 family)
MQSLVESWFRAALRRWPTVNWPMERYGLHVGASVPKHPEDLFLGGAASERLPEAWAAIQEDIRPEVLRRVSRVRSRTASPEDLWSEAIVRLMAEDQHGSSLPDGSRPTNIVRFRGDAPLASFIAVVAKRAGIDLLRRDAAAAHREHFASVQRLGRQPSPEQDAIEAELAQRFAADFRDAFGSLPPSRQALLSLVYGQRLPKSEAGRLLGMPDYKVSRELAASMETLRERLSAPPQGDWTPEAARMWLRVWTESPLREDGGASRET